MSKFFLRLNSGAPPNPDHECNRFGSVETARSSAMAAARELMASTLWDEGFVDLKDSFLIVDRDGNTVSRVTFAEAVDIEL
ncbi:MAG: hypothetical protein JWM36_822 [Hyphomicrobiales bacterium]|nr:hypothetical protein [Hyphomicrobiales bacterium]